MTASPIEFSVTVDDGKYTYQRHVDGKHSMLRYGEPWPAYDSLSNAEIALLYRVEELMKLVEEQRLRS